MPRINRNSPTSLRAEATRLRAYADRLNAESDRASANAPGSYITGGSGRSRAMNKRTERALEKTITNAGKSNAARRKAVLLERRAAWLESGGPERDYQRKIANRQADASERKTAKAVLKAGSLEDRLFVGCYPSGLVFADRAVEKNGDYQTLGMLSDERLTLTFQPDCPPMWRSFIQGYCTPIQLDPAKYNADRPLTMAQYGSHANDDLTDRLFERAGSTWVVNGYAIIYRGNEYACHALENRDDYAILNEKELRPLILAWEAAHATGDHPIITGPDGRTYPRLESTHDA